MGIHGLTTFIQRYHDKHKEKAYLHDCPVVIDGCNLMFFLYFESRQVLPTNGGSTTPKKGATSSPLSKPSPMKQPHLFGGDYMTYAQNVREFFQHMKLCGITSIVVFDGAYDSLKIKTAFKRFAENLKDNVKSSGNNLKGVYPGSSYCPVFMKAVFVEVLQEQKIPHYQTEGEADCTIAFIARKLGNCPILSSDSDFHIYVNSKVLPLHTLRFKKVAPLKDKRKSPPNNDKLWTLHSQYVSLPKLCREEFNFKDARLLPLAAVILGNDWIRTSTFSHFHSATAGGATVKRNSRIAYLLKWLGKQRSYSRVLHAMLSTVRESNREKISKLVNEIVSIYEGMGGEEKVWKMLLETGLIDKYVASEDFGETEVVIEDILDKLSLDESNTLINISVCEDFDDDETNIEEVDDDADENDTEDVEDQHFENAIKLPEWYLNAHIKGWFPTYLLKLVKNQMVFLSPQAEVSSLESTHNLATPIIQTIAHLLLGKGKTLTLVTRHRSKIIKVEISSTSNIQSLQDMPVVISENGEDIRKSFSLEFRTQIILETLGLQDPNFIAFLNQWPVSLRIWIISLIYFINKSKNDSNEGLNLNLLVSPMTIPIAVSILLSVVKNSVLNPSGSSRNSETSQDNNCTLRISDLLNQSDVTDISKLRAFYIKFEGVVDTSSRIFSRSYDITKTYNISRFTCILFHLHQLNRLLGDPFRSPRLNYNLNNWFVYNLAGKLFVENRVEQEISNVVKEVCEVDDIALVIHQFLSFA